MIIKKLTEEELAILEILRNPLWCGEFVHNYEEEIPWEYTEYQKDILLDFSHYVSLRAGRAVGKTVVLIDRLTWYALNLFWDETIVYTVPNRVHLDPVFLRITRWFRRHKFLKHFSGPQGINSQTYNVKLLNRAVIDCRIAGQTGTGISVVGLHVPVIILDESGFYPWNTYLELLPCLNTFQEGFQFTVSGVPIGTRERNVLYHADQKDDKFSRHRITAHQNPRYSDEDEERNIKQFGGVESDDYQHIVLGEHGSPTYTLFDRTRMLISTYSLFTGTLTGDKLLTDLDYLDRFYEALPKPPNDAVLVTMGIDLGYTDPSAIHIYYKTVKDGPYKILARITLRQIKYPDQEKFIDRLDSIYNPSFIGVDEGSSGKAVTQHLFEDNQYKHKRYKDKLVAINFRSLIPVGFDSEGKEQSVRAKQFGMQLLQSMVNSHEINFSSRDEELISELERTTYNKTATGELVFRTLSPHGGVRHADDHNLSAMLCMVIAQHLTEGLEYRVHARLYKPRWGI